MSDIVGYTYQADVYCGEDIRPAVIAQLPDLFGGAVTLDWEGPEDFLDRVAKDWFGIDRADEWTFDTDVFPKVIFSDSNVGLACGTCNETIGA